MKAVNSIGVASCSAELLVHMEAPTFTQALQDTPVKVTDTAHLTCKVKGIPRPEVTWLLDDKPVTEGPKHLTTYEGDEITLNITDVTLEDVEVTYTCRASNPAGEATTSAHLVAQGRWPAVCAGLYDMCLQQCVLLFCMCIIQNHILHLAAVLNTADRRFAHRSIVQFG